MAINVSNITNTASGAINNAVGNVSSTANKLQSQITAEIKNSVPTIDTSSITSALDSLGGIGTSISNLADSARQQANALISQGSNLLNSTLESVSSSFPSAISDYFSSTSSDILGLNTTNGDSAKGPKEVDSKITSLASDAAEALSKPVSFVSKAVSDTISGSDTLTQSANLSNLVGSMSNLELGNIAKATGINISSDSDLSNAITSVTNELSSIAKSATATVGELTSSIVEPIVSTSKDYVGSFMNGITSTVSSTLSGIGTGGSDVINAIQELSSSVYDVLPSSVQSYVSNRTSSYISSTVSSVLNKYENSTSHILSELSGIVSSNDVVGKLLSFGNGTVYNTITDSIGGNLTNLFGNILDKSQIDTIYSVAQSICPNIKTYDIKEYNTTKDLFDYLLSLSGDLGLSDLLSQLANCKGGELNLFDSRSTSVVQSVASNAAKSGNVFMYESARGAIGNANLPNVEDNIVTLVSNAKMDEDTQTEFGKLTENLHINVSELITSEPIDGIQAYNGGRIAAMSTTDTTIIDGTFGADSRKLVQSSYLAYASSL